MHKYMLYSTFILFLLVALTGCSSDQTANNTSNYTIATLETGLNTIVWEVDDQKNDVELRLVIKTGSLSEEKGERGFAHFVEHLAFNNTVKYPKETLFRKLEAFGMSFGAHSNAQTGFDSTIYKLSVKNATDEKLDRAMDILAQWAMYVQFDQAIVDAEKGVIREEWRLRKPQEAGWQEKYLKTLHQNSRYADRLPIGDINDIEAADAVRLRQFYERWYQPDNAAVIVTGSVKTDQVNQLIKKYFAEWKSKEQTPDNKYNISTEHLPEHQFLADKKVDGSSIQLSYLIPGNRPQSREAVFSRLEWVSALSILEQRLRARLQETSGKVNGVDVSRYYPSPDVLAVTVSAGVPGDGLEVATKLLNEEVAFLLKEGVTGEELAAWKNRSLQRSRTVKDTSRSVAGMAVRYVLYGQPAWVHSDWLAAIEQVYPEITAGQVNAAIKRLLSESPRILMVHNPSIPVPADTQLSQWLVSSARAGKARKPSLPTHQEGGEWLINPEASGNITASRKITERLHEWTLSNGIVVYYRFSDERPGKVWYQLSGVGGTNVLSQQDSIIARLALETIGASGLRDMDGPQLAQWLSNQNLSQYPFFGFFDRGMTGSGGSKDFPKLLRLLHVALTEGRVDPKAWKHNLENNRQQLKQLAKSRTRPWREQTDRILFGDDAAFRMLTMEELDAVEPEQLMQLYNRDFAGAQNYRLVIVGDLAEADARQAVEESVASLPPSSRATHTPNRVFPRITAAEDIVVAGSGERSAVVIYKLTLPKTEIPEGSFRQLSYLQPWVNSALLETLREKEGLVYSVNTTFESALQAVEDYTLTIQLACDPDKVNEVREKLQSTLEKLVMAPPEQERLVAWNHARVSGLTSALKEPIRLANMIITAEQSFIPLDLTEDVIYLTRLPEQEQLMTALAKLTQSQAIPVWMVWLP